MKNIFYLNVFLLMILLSSCGTYVYKSVSAKTPLLAKKNDFVGQLSLGGGGGEIYAAYAPIKYLGFSLAYAGSTTRSDSAGKSEIKFRDYEISLVPFFAQEIARFEMPLGIAQTKTISLTNAFNTFSPYTRMFAQPTVGFFFDNFETAVFLRISRLEYSRKSWGVDQRYEPGFMVRGGSKNIKGLLQMRLDYGTNYSSTTAAGLPIDQQVLYLPFHISLGVNFNFNFDKKSKVPDKN